MATAALTAALTAAGLLMMAMMVVVVVLQGLQICSYLIVMASSSAVETCVAASPETGAGVAEPRRIP
jgi:hypothetical protein